MGKKGWLPVVARFIFISLESMGVCGKTPLNQAESLRGVAGSAVGLPGETPLRSQQELWPASSSNSSSLA